MSNEDVVAVAVARTCLGDGGPAYARHLVSASNAVPKLEAEIRALNGKVKRLRGLLDEACMVAYNAAGRCEDPELRRAVDAIRKEAAGE